MRKMPPTAGVGYHELFICRPSQLLVQHFTLRLYHVLWDVALCCVRKNARNALSCGTKALVFLSVVREGLSHVKVYVEIPVAKMYTARHFAVIRGGSLTCERRKAPPPPHQAPPTREREGSCRSCGRKKSTWYIQQMIQATVWPGA